MTLVDAHHHFFLPDRFEYPWMQGPAAVLRRRRGPEELAPRLASSEVATTVVVQACASTAETAELLRLASLTVAVAGVVGWVDLTGPEVAEAIDALRGLPGGDALVGVRHQVHDEPDPAWLDRPNVRRGLRAVAGAGLCYDALVRERELPALIRLARDLPELRVVVDHLAKPRIAEHGWQPWASGLGELSRHPQVAVKVSGLVTEADWGSWTITDLQPYVDAALGWFGPSRVMLGSDWPVCELAGSYEVVIGAYRHCAGQSPGSDLVLSGTARRWYRLGAPA